MADNPTAKDVSGGLRTFILQERTMGRLTRYQDDTLTALASQIDAAIPVIITSVPDTIRALKNYGADTKCGACMEVAFTGVTTNQHTCQSKP